MSFNCNIIIKQHDQRDLMYHQKHSIHLKNTTYIFSMATNKKIHSLRHSLDNLWQNRLDYTIVQIDFDIYEKFNIRLVSLNTTRQLLILFKIQSM